MRIASLSLLLIVSWTAAAQTVWKYVDEQGVTHYTDQPVPGAEKIQLRSGSITGANQASSAATSTTVSQQSQGSYQSFEIVKPGDQESVVNTGGLLQVSMQLSPSLKMGHVVTLYLDGKPVEGFAPTTLQYEVRDVPRGVHTLQGVIQDGEGQRISETRRVTFTMRQTSIATPPVGPAIRPPSKPSTPRPPSQSSQPSFADLNPQQTTTKK